MLVLTRKIDERITIGDDIELVVVDIDTRGGRVRLGIKAPEDIEIHRKENGEGKSDLARGRLLHRVRGGQNVSGENKNSPDQG